MASGHPMTGLPVVNLGLRRGGNGRWRRNRTWRPGGTARDEQRPQQSADRQRRRGPCLGSPARLGDAMPNPVHAASRSIPLRVLLIEVQSGSPGKRRSASDAVRRLAGGQTVQHLLALAIDIDVENLQHPFLIPHLDRFDRIAHVVQAVLKHTRPLA